MKKTKIRALNNKNRILLKKKLYILVGASASGKTTVENKLIEKGYVNRVISYTSRKIRESEVDGIDYYFDTVENILSRKNVLEIKINPSWIYAVSEKELLSHNSSCDLVYSCINIKPAEDIYRYIKKNKLSIKPIIVFFDIDVNQRIELLKKRGETDEDIQIRLSREDKFSDFSIQPSFCLTNIYSAYDDIIKKGGMNVCID